MTRGQIDREIQEAKFKDLAEHGEDRSKMPVGTLLTTIMFAGRDRSGEMCPVFALRLRGPDGRQLADVIRQTMRGETAAEPAGGVR
jgi:hypothetical protein